MVEHTSERNGSHLRRDYLDCVDPEAKNAGRLRVQCSRSLARYTSYLKIIHSLRVGVFCKRTDAWILLLD